MKYRILIFTVLMSFILFFGTNISLENAIAKTSKSKIVKQDTELEKRIAALEALLNQIAELISSKNITSSPSPSPSPTPTPTPTPSPSVSPTPTPTPISTPNSIFLLPPTNLHAIGKWDSSVSKPTDTLYWNAADNAVSYKIYQYDELIGTTTQTNFVVPIAKFFDSLLYTVTSVAADGNESIYSAPTSTQSAYDPSLPVPNWFNQEIPFVPENVIIKTEWNNGKPRNSISWDANSRDATYSVYKDGIKIASNLWSLNYIDSNIESASNHSYEITGTTFPYFTPAESAKSSAISIIASSAKPASNDIVNITSIVSNDDSVIVKFAAIPGAIDYRGYFVGKPNSAKYSAGGLSIEMNNINPTTGSDIIIEAVDKLGPFEKMDGKMGPMPRLPDNTIGMTTNGQGDPSNVPNMIAKSAITHVNCIPINLVGTQSFFDKFRNNIDFVKNISPDPVIYAINGDSGLEEFTNDKWLIRQYGVDKDNTGLFFMSQHFMDTLYDGGTPRSNIGPHNNNASLAMTPKTGATFNYNKVFHITFEVDAHFDSRRWCDLVIAAKNDPLIHPGKLDGGLHPTVSGKSLRWEITGQFHQLQVYTGNNTPEVNLIDTSYGPNSERFDNRVNVAREYNLDNRIDTFNGSVKDLDKRHKFDIYISKTHYRLIESGIVIKDADFPAGMIFPFDDSAVLSPYFIHQVYHSSLDRAEIVSYSRSERYWINLRPYMDERHWDNMGYEILDNFPALN